MDGPEKGAMLTMIHGDEQYPIQKYGKITMKPKCVKEYNEKMGSVDKIDMLLSSMKCARNKIIQNQIIIVKCLLVV